MPVFYHVSRNAVKQTFAHHRIGKTPFGVRRKPLIKGDLRRHRRV
jgi:hypothetical protein